MADNVENGSRKRGLAWIGSLCIGLPLFYVLSIGPAVFVCSKTKSDTMETYAEKFYAPLVWFSKQNTALTNPLESYVLFWIKLAGRTI
jgi:hypothetical protein